MWQKAQKKNVKYCLSYGHFLTDFILIGGKVDIW